MKITRIEQIAIRTGNKIYIEGKISRRNEDLRKENDEIEQFIYKNYDIDDYDMKEALIEVLF